MSSNTNLNDVCVVVAVVVVVVVVAFLNFSSIVCPGARFSNAPGNFSGP